ncbi:transcriptional regulator, TetR family [Candidatus Vecturithrix granuli]|uniref:Transcriptional regulator, TetR family n=1 Tax=Vecturithrix granuli TaxID=1499967 RepID=A0A081BWU6_VECG1|nr:transcriptional regulator, TetR family [Candidatus Vecturithrix granuli]
MKTETITPQSQETIRNILDTAAQIFAEVGFAGARVDEIARRANVNKAAIYYHIGSKEALYAQVLQEIFSDLSERIVQHVQEAQMPEEKLRVYIRQIGQTLQTRPQLAAIMMREIASGAQHLPDVIMQTLVQMISILTTILKQGEEAGVFTPSIPLMIHFMIVGQFIFLRTSKHLISQHQEAVPESFKSTHQTISETIVEEVENLVLRAVKK